MRAAGITVFLFPLIILLTIACAAQNVDTSTEKIFSGKCGIYADDYNGYKIKVPVEFEIRDKGATTDWTGPKVNEFVCSMSVNVTEMPDTSSQVMYDANIRSKKKDRDFTDVVPVKVRFGKKTAYAFRCKEANHKAGSREEKAPDDHHRWHLYVFGNGRSITCGFSAPYSAFRENKVQAMYEAVIKSFELIATKP